MEEIPIGRVVHFFAAPMAAAVKIEKGFLVPGEVLHFKGRTTDLYHRVDSLQVNGCPVDRAEAGETAGVRLDGRARENDRVFKIEE